MKERLVTLGYEPVGSTPEERASSDALCPAMT